MTKARNLADFISDATVATAEIADNAITPDKLQDTGNFTLNNLNSTGNISLGDNNKAIFGAGSDLQIYHNAGTSFITESGSSNFKIGGENLYLQNTAHNENYLAAIANQGVTVYYNNAPKLATTSTGVDITGTITADGLTVGGNILRDVDNNSIFISGGNAAATGGNIGLYGSTSGNSNDILLRRNNVKFAAFDGATGDISFYEDTGTTAKLFWDASAESLGIGTDSPSAKLSVTGLAMNSASSGVELEGSWPWLKFKDTESNQDSWLQYIDASNFIVKQIAYADRNSAPSTVGTERMRIDSSGAVVINNSGGDAQLYLGGTSGTSRMYLARSGADSFLWNVSNGNIRFGTNNTERMRIKSTGDVGIGTGGDFTVNDITGSGYGLVIGSSSASSAGIQIRTGTTGAGNIYFGDNSGSDAGRYDGFIQYSQNTRQFNIGTARETAMVIDSSGNVGVGVAPATSYGNVLQIHDTGTSGANLRLTDNTSGSATGNGFEIIQIGVNNYTINRENGFIATYTNGSEAMRIDASGNLLVGKTSTAFATAGVNLQPNGRVDVTRSGGQAAYLNRTTSDGDIVGFYKDGAVVGTIETSGGNLIVQGSTSTGKTGIKFGGAEWIPQDNGNSDGGVDLGTSSARFKDLYLSNNITLTNATTSSFLQVSSNILQFGTSSADPVAFYANNAERMRIDSSGFTGFGTSTPKRHIHLNGGNESTKIQITNQTTGSGTDGDGFQLGIATDGTANLEQRENASMVFTTNNTERMRILADGNVGIGAASPLAMLDIKGNTTTYDGMAKIYLTDSNSNSNSRNWSIGNGGSAFGNLTFAVSAAKDGVAGDGTSINAMVIDNTGNVGIGITSPAQLLHVQAGATGNGAIRVGGGAGLEISHDNSSNTVQRIDSLYRTTSNDANLQLRTGTFTVHTGTSSTERMRIDSSGNLLVGTTNGNPTGSHEPGTVITEYGQINIHRDNGNPLRLGNSVDGNLTEYYKQGALVATIGVGGGRPHFVANDGSTGGGFKVDSTQFYPVDRVGTTSNGVLNLGANNARWKDLYLSGGVYLGGTGAANKLDDYEEGTFTPDVGSSSGSGGAATGKTGNYTRIGNRVFADWFLTVNTLGSMSGTFYITGFPFAASATNVLAQGAVRSQGIGGSNDIPVTFEMLAGNSYGRFHFMSGSSGQRTVQVSDISASDFIAASISYIV